MIYLIDPKDAHPAECRLYCFLKCPLFNLPRPLYGMPPD